ncbi:aromatic ring-hydroxylating dioxygenase subunit alpha [Phormidium tenue FACHB-886]|nr:aromatic ring-hydroxylating dioxygenase subunit alpha [Phormidium tenue FACHB-886]
MNIEEYEKSATEPDNGTHSAVQYRDTRRSPINPNYWYAVACSSELQANPLSVTLWHQAIVLYRDSTGRVQALEDRCPHRQVKLSEGRVQGDVLECAYHGWQFNAIGQCSHVPYLAENQKLPACLLRTYPVREQDGFIWLFPGDVATLQAEAIQPLALPEWNHLNYIASVATIECQAHFSFLIENLMDMYHGHLHENYQAWADPKLETLEVEDDQIHARYQAQSYYKIDKIWSVSQLFFPALRRLHPEPLDVSYLYPHWASTLGQDFKIYCLFCPVHETQTRAYLIHFTSLHAFSRLHKLSERFRRFVKRLCFNAAKGLLEGLIRQDVKMIEQEQQAYLHSPDRRSYELNPALASVQRLIREQGNRNWER